MNRIPTAEAADALTELATSATDLVSDAVDHLPEWTDVSETIVTVADSGVRGGRRVVRRTTTTVRDHPRIATGGLLALVGVVVAWFVLRRRSDDEATVTSHERWKVDAA